MPPPTRRKLNFDHGTVMGFPSGTLCLPQHDYTFLFPNPADGGRTDGPEKPAAQRLTDLPVSDVRPAPSGRAISLRRGSLREESDRVVACRF